MPCPDIDPEVCPEFEPGDAPAVPAPPAVPPVCSDASTIPLFRKCAVGPGAGAGVLVHWSAILVALVTLNCFAVPAVAELEFIPEFAAEGMPEVEAVAPAPPFCVFAEAVPFVADPSWPVT